MYHVIKYVQSLTNVSVNNEINKNKKILNIIYFFSFFDNSMQVAEYYRIIRILQNPQSQSHNYISSITIPQLQRKTCRKHTQINK